MVDAMGRGCVPGGCQSCKLQRFQLGFLRYSNYFLNRTGYKNVPFLRIDYRATGDVEMLMVFEINTNKWFVSFPFFSDVINYVIIT